MTGQPGQKPPADKRSSQEAQEKKRLDDVRKRTRDRRSVVENAEKK